MTKSDMDRMARDMGMKLPGSKVSASKGGMKVGGVVAR